MTHTVNLAGLEVTLEAGHPAWDCFEKTTGQSVLLRARAWELYAARVTAVQVWSWALSQKWRAKHAPTMLYESWLDILPPVLSSGWVALRDLVRDQFAVSFYGTTWNEFIKTLEENARDAIAKAEAEILDG